MAWEEKEVAVFVDHHHGEEDLFIPRIDAMNVVNVGIMLEIAIVTGVVVEVAGAGMYAVWPLCSFCFESSSFLTVQYCFISDTNYFWVLIFNKVMNSKLIW